MSFCWFTSFIGYPNFFKDQGRGYDQAESFLKFAQAALSGITYTDAKSLFSNLDTAQVETKKAAFQEFGLLYVAPRSNTITLTPVGKQIYELCSNTIAREDSRRTILLALSRALARYQFNNPLPVGGPRHRERSSSTDVLPYLAYYYLVLKLDGLITVSELRGAIFGLQNMSDIRTLEQSIKDHRQSRTPFSDLSTLPLNKNTATNLKIYFMSHASLDNEIIKDVETDLYGIKEQAYSITQLGYELIQLVVDEQWMSWNSSDTIIPVARIYESYESYFSDGVGQSYSPMLEEKDKTQIRENAAQIAENVLDEDEVESLKELDRREFEEGKQRLVQHERLEKTRNPNLVNEAKRLFRIKNGKLFCEACMFDFELKYGLRGKDYIEAHHKKPISSLEGPVNNNADDLAMVCSNCHRMLHRPPWISVDELKVILQSNSREVREVKSED